MHPMEETERNSLAFAFVVAVALLLVSDVVIDIAASLRHQLQAQELELRACYDRRGK